MKKSLSKDTLAYQFGIRPGVLHRDMRSVSVPDVVKQMNVFMSHDTVGKMVKHPTTEPTQGNPERDAIMFYMMNHAVSLIRQKAHPYEPLSADWLTVVDMYHTELALRSARMFFYLLLICTRESRHDKSEYGSAHWHEFHKKYGPVLVDFHKSIKGSGSAGAAIALRTNPPKMALGPYTEFLAEVFYKGKYSGGYGGKAWGQVADVLRDYVHGKITAEMMMDTAFTLCHNNGPIFNKGMLFDQYSPEIYTILDVQRSGQIPAMIANQETKWAKDPYVTERFNQCKVALSSDFSGYVDWFLVEELGAMKSYPSQKDAQVKKHGYPSKFKAKLEVEKVKKEIAVEQKKQEDLQYLEIMPGLKVKKIKIERVEA